jgi:hypothetical protein
VEQTIPTGVQAGNLGSSMKLKLPSTDTGHGFKVWEYRVSHKQLLLRRPKATDSSKNLDVMFSNVQYMDLPSTLPDLEIEEPNKDDIAFAESRAGKKALKNDKVFVLKSDNRRHVIVAGDVAVRESSMGLFESPFTLPPVEIKPRK